MYNKLCIFSYNSRGFSKPKQEFLKTLTIISGDSLPVICNQENFLLKSNEYFARNALPDHHIIFNPATKESLDGRPINGMFVAVPDSIKEKVRDISPPSKRMQSLMFNFDTCKILLINTYFPTDPKTNNFDDTDLYVLLSQIRGVIADNDFDQVIVTGDLNTDFKRNTRFVNIVREFVSELNLCKSWDNHPIDFTHVTELNGNTYTSTIDHFLYNDAKTSLIDAGSLHHPENMSDHCPIYMKINIPDINNAPKIKDNTKFRSIPRWNKATEEQKTDFCGEVDESIQALDLPICLEGCRDVHCCNDQHFKALDNLMLDLLQCVERAADEHLPKPKKSNSENSMKIPNWKSEIEPFKEKSQFWHAVWESAGRPVNCELHRIMKRTRNIYHLHIRKNKRLLERLKKNSLMTACIDNKIDFFDAIKRQRRCKKTQVTSMDGHTEDIPEHLASTYKKLYNSLDDKENISSVEETLKERIDENSWSQIDSITWKTVKECSKKLKCKKTDPFMLFSSDCLSNAPDSFYQVLCFLFKSYMSHGHVSDFLLVSTMIPLIKNKMGNITSSSNYRSIALSSLILKIFDNIILATFSEALQLDELQFGYQEEVSTSMCTWLALETISYFHRNGSEVYTCLMDMSKAFDTVKHSLLFKKLLDQGLPPVVVRYLLVTYKLQKANVTWNNEVSDFFSISNGVKQGAVLSAVLYCVYTNELFQKLRRSNIGCSIGQNYVGVVGYADDIFLLSPSIDGLQKMLYICEVFANDHNLKFSTDPNPSLSKTKCLVFSKKENDLPKLKLCGNELPWVKVGKHLGVKVENNPLDLIGQDIKEKRAQYIQRNNELVQEFAYAACDTKAQINRIYNSHFTGSVLWNLLDIEANKVYNTWSVSIRKMFRLDRKTHRYFIEPISKIPHIKISMMKRFWKFSESLSQTKKKTVANVYQAIAEDCQSTLGTNRRLLKLTCNTPKVQLKTIEKLSFYKTPKGEEWRESVVEDLINVRDNQMYLKDWKKEEIAELLYHVCVT